MKLDVVVGTTSKLVNFLVQDSTRADGSGLINLTSSTSGLTAYYYRSGSVSSTSITLTTMTVGTWVSGGFSAIDATNMPGLYQLGIPNSALGGGANSVTIMLRGAANMVPIMLEIQLTGYDPTSGTNLGLSALPTATAGASGGLLVNDHLNDSVISASPTSSSFAGSNALSSSDNFYNSSILVFTSGSLKGIARKVAGYTGSTRTFAFDAAYPTAPAQNDTFVLIGRIP
jgi:hypothetical protein